MRVVFINNGFSNKKNIEEKWRKIWGIMQKCQIVMSTLSWFTFQINQIKRICFIQQGQFSFHITFVELYY